MADNEGLGSPNPRTKNTNDISETAANDRDTAEETESQNFDNVAAPQSKRRKTSAADANQNTAVREQVNASRNNGISTTVGPGPGQQPIYEGAGTLISAGKSNQFAKIDDSDIGTNKPQNPPLLLPNLAANLMASEVLRQQQEAAQRNRQFILAQREGINGRPSTLDFMHPNMATMMIANQLPHVGGIAPFFQNAQVQSNNELQQLSIRLQQHLYGVGLAQTLGMNQHSPGGGSFSDTTSLFAQSTSTPGSATNSDYFPASLQATATRNTTTNSISAMGSSMIDRNDDAAIPTTGSRSLEAVPQNESRGGLTGRSPIPLYISCDDDSLSEYQCLVRKQIELFEATEEDVESNAQGRNRPIVLGQVGIRCRHCTTLPPKQRSRGAIYYPSKLPGIYQAAQNLAVAHLGEHCQHVPDDLRATLSQLRERKSAAGCGKRYWANGVSVLGVFEDRDGLRFESTFPQNSGAN